MQRSFRKAFPLASPLFHDERVTAETSQTSLGHYMQENLHTIKTSQASLQLDQIDSAGSEHMRHVHIYILPNHRDPLDTPPRTKILSRGTIK